MECQHCILTNKMDPLGRRFVIPRSGGLPKIQCSDCANIDSKDLVFAAKEMKRQKALEAYNLANAVMAQVLVEASKLPDDDELFTYFEQLKIDLWYKHGISNKILVR